MIQAYAVKRRRKNAKALNGEHKGSQKVPSIRQKFQKKKTKNKNKELGLNNHVPD